MEKKEEILRVRNLDISFETTAGVVNAVRGVNLTVNRGETVAIVGESGSGKSVTALALMHLLEQTGLAEQKYKRADELSGGQMQRVGICRSLIQNPKLILADEPIASLDPKSAEIVMEALYQMTTSRGLTCVVNLHQVDFAKKYATRIIGIKAGHVVYDGLPGDLTDAMIRSIYEGKERQMKLRSELVYA